MEQEQIKRVTQALKDGKELLEHWRKQAESCDNCKVILDDLNPFMAGLNTILKELGG